MKRFEYTNTRCPSPAEVTGVVASYNEMGEQGWELVGYNYGHAFWKREVDPEQPVDNESRLQRDARMRGHLLDAHDSHPGPYDPADMHKAEFPECKFEVAGS